MKSYTKGQQPPFLSDKSVANRFEVHRATVWRWSQSGTFPAPVKINGSTRWKLSDIEAWEAKQGWAGL
ncbi:putative AlpA family transcriptional regulator [Alcanivorax sp. NBRC 101098]|jgi:predicted DNA-binding transcriptional regulator AlpA|uniref:helix-turn-helix transcriptional regulator n=1 Tax=Alcanivorax sp. NBRC 101098 TaxID=1113728 RepID=UPI0004ABEC0D|nr:helix-turn-helix domain-containing protein [Alcanivorax sp. NBRC 101098]BAP13785.1 putative AlpA family transcriptional regulator [Alcanivorax sp. NBRC 101098]